MNELTERLKAVTDMAVQSINETHIRDLFVVLVRAYDELRADHLALVRKVNATASNAATKSASKSRQD